MSVSDCELLVIGSGPAGQKGAIAAARAGKRVALVARTIMMGGRACPYLSITSKTHREAIFQLTGFAVKALYGNGYRSHGDIPIDELSSRVNAIERFRGFAALWGWRRQTLWRFSRNACGRLEQSGL